MYRIDTQYMHLFINVKNPIILSVGDRTYNSIDKSLGVNVKFIRASRGTVRASVVLAAILLAILLPFQNCAPLESGDGSSDLSSLQDSDFADKCTNELHVKPVPPQRLTKDEYNNAVRDLLGTSQNFSADFSDDPVGSTGYNTEADSQSISVEMIHDYWTGSQAVVDAVFAKAQVPIMTCASGAACATEIIRNLTLRAFRRPATSEELQLYIDLFNKETSTVFKEKIKTVTRAVLMSPQFLFRTYEVPAQKGSTVVSLNPYEFASRISFFIWGSIPDAELLQMAADNSIFDSTSLDKKVRTMLTDPRSVYLSRRFTAQWLNLSALNSVVRSTAVFPTWSPNVRNSMREETLFFLQNVFSQNKNVSDIIGADYTYVDQNLANHYELTGDFSNQFTKVQLDNTRRGILTQGSFLSITASEDYTSPIKRGVNVLHRIVCSPPPEPPPNIPALPAAPGNDDLLGESAIRSRLAQHRATGGACFACHKVMDPVGLSFENFTAVGTYRTKYNDGKAVDAAGELPTGERFRDAAELASFLKEDSRFPACLASNMSSFATGTDMHESFKNCQIRKIASESLKPESTIADLVINLIQSDEFRFRKTTYNK